MMFPQSRHSVSVNRAVCWRCVDVVSWLELSIGSRDIRASVCTLKLIAKIKNVTHIS